MINKPVAWVVTRIKGTSQDYLSSYHLSIGDRVSDSTWSAEEICAIQFISKEEAEAVSDRFPGSFVEEFIGYEDEE